MAVFSQPYNINPALLEQNKRIQDEGYKYLQELQAGPAPGQRPTPAVLQAIAGLAQNRLKSDSWTPQEADEFMRRWVTPLSGSYASAAVTDLLRHFVANLKEKDPGYDVSSWLNMLDSFAQHPKYSPTARRQMADANWANWLQQELAGQFYDPATGQTTMTPDIFWSLVGQGEQAERQRRQFPGFSGGQPSPATAPARNIAPQAEQTPAPGGQQATASLYDGLSPYNPALASNLLFQQLLSQAPTQAQQPLLGPRVESIPVQQVTPLNQAIQSEVQQPAPVETQKTPLEQALEQNAPQAVAQQAAQQTMSPPEQNPLLQYKIGKNFVARQGAKGENVRSVQQALAILGFDIKADGVFGPNTTAAVKSFQREIGLSPDGVIGKDTIGAINSIIDQLATIQSEQEAQAQEVLQPIKQLTPEEFTQMVQEGNANPWYYLLTPEAVVAKLNYIGQEDPDYQSLLDYAKLYNSLVMNNGSIPDMNLAYNLFNKAYQEAYDRKAAQEAARLKYLQEKEKQEWEREKFYTETETTRRGQDKSATTQLQVANIREAGADRRAANATNNPQKPSQAEVSKALISTFLELAPEYKSKKDMEADFLTNRAAQVLRYLTPAEHKQLIDMIINLDDKIFGTKFKASSGSPLGRALNRIKEAMN